MKAGSLLCATLRPEADLRRDELARVWAAPPPGTAELIRHEGAGLWLHRRLSVLGLRDQVEPGLLGALRQQVLVTAGVNLRVDEEARRALKLLGGAGIPVILIKGLARRALASRWPLLDARGVSDVDLLVPPDQIDAAWEQLRAAGYEMVRPGSEARYEEHHHFPALMGPGRVAIELHRSSSIQLPAAVAWARFEAGAEEVSWQGQRVTVPSATELAWHTVSHASTDGVQGFRLRHWMDLVALVSGGAQVDWSVIGQRLAAERIPDGLTLEPVAPEVPRDWLGGLVALLPPAQTEAWARLARPVNLERLLNGRARLLAWQSGAVSVKRRLQVEWTRGMLGWPFEPVMGSAWRRTRGRTVGVAARGAARLMNL